MGGRRVLISRQWSGKTLADHKADRRDWVKALLGITADDGESQNGGKWMPLADIERKYVEQVLAHTRGNKQAASRILNIDRKTLARIVARGSTAE